MSPGNENSECFSGNSLWLIIAFWFSKFSWLEWIHFPFYVDSKPLFFNLLNPEFSRSSECQDIPIWIAFPSDWKSIRSICTGFILVSDRNIFVDKFSIVWNIVIHNEKWPPLLGSLNPYWQISGKFLRPFYWKTHPSKNYEYLFSFFKTRVVS